jgi:SagB-type dehydrogenase family enzyme
MTIRDYHERTKHSVASIRSNPHTLDWANQPLPFKVYKGLQPIPLRLDPSRSDVPALQALAAVDGGDGGLDPRRLARLLYYSAGVIRTKTYPGGQVRHFRAAACTGALYHIDLYLVTGDLPGLEAGVYHFGPHDFALRRLRAGDHRGAVLAASGGEPRLAAAPAALICTSTFWRNAWKYQARTYRHCFWDCGTLLANLLAVAAADRVAASVVMGFADREVNRLLDLDPAREVALALVPLGAGAAPPPAPPPPAPLGLATEPLSEREVDYPLIRAAHAATSLPDGAAAAAWRGAAPPRPVAGTPAASAARALPSGAPQAPPIEAAILRRGSARRFARAPIEVGGLAAMLRAATRGVPFDFNAPERRALVEPYLIVNAVDGLAPGTYYVDATADALVRLRQGEFRREAGFLDLGQELAADAAVNVYLLADLDRVLAAYGDRGYRAAQMEAAIVGGKLYLAAYALGLGATGLTFFDDDVTAFFMPHAAGKAVMFLIALGRSAPARM